MKIFLIKLASLLCTIQLLVQLCKCELKYPTIVDDYQPKLKSKIKPDLYDQYLPTRKTRFELGQGQPRVYEDEKDCNLKEKIALLVNQTMIDVRKRLKKTEKIKADHREESPYKVGFILCMIRKAKNVMDELFNVAVKHKDQWKSLQHLKVFELIVHTNVDSTNLLRQLVDVHLKHVNSTLDVKRKG